MQFLRAENFYFLWLLPVLGSCFAWAAFKRCRAARIIFGIAAEYPHLAAVSSSRRRIKEICVLSAAVFMILALARPAWDTVERTISRRGRDVVFLIDVSRSMLAEDVRPNRLERAKLAVIDALEVVDGDRIALVAFAGSVIVRSPLTLDYGFFRMTLEDLSVEDAGGGGTMLGDAIRTAALEIFDDGGSAHKDIILITDGEDQGSFPVEAAAVASEQGIRLIVIGFGDENEGARIPVYQRDGERRFFTYRGQEVWTRLDSAALEKIAGAVKDGYYFNVGVGAIDFAAVYQQLISRSDKKGINEERITSYEERFQLAVLAALFLLILELFISERRKGTAFARSHIIMAAFLCLAPTVFTPQIFAQDLASHSQSEVEELRARTALQLYNEGVELYRSGSFKEALQRFEQTTKSPDRILQAKSHYNSGNSLYRIAQSEESSAPNMSLEFYELSAAHYESAFAAYGYDADAAYNLELVRRKIATMRQEQQSKQPQQCTDGQNDDKKQNSQQDREDVKSEQERPGSEDESSEEQSLESAEQDRDYGDPEGDPEVQELQDYSDAINDDLSQEDVIRDILEDEKRARESQRAVVQDAEEAHGKDW